MFRCSRQLSVIMIVTLSALTVFGCSKFFAPKDEEIIKAVQNSSLFMGGFITLQSPVTIVEKMSRGSDGKWPVKVKITLSYKSNKALSFKSHPNNAKPVEVTEEKTLIFKLSKVEDGTGKKVWKAEIAG